MALFQKNTHSSISASLSTSTNAAVQAIVAQTGQVFSHGMIFNPESQPAGQWSYDNFTNHIDSIPAGLSATMIPGGLCQSGISIRRIPNGSNLVGVRVILF